jgi:hypothetical protein
MATNYIFSGLPTENWNDAFGFLRQALLAQIVPQIGDSYFASKAQFYLHECGKITLGNLEISSKPSEDGNERVPVILKEGRRELQLADVPIPANIKNFRQIRIRFT